MTGQILDEPSRRLVAAARRAVLATVDPAGRPRLVPICFVLDEATRLYSPIDDKPKASADWRRLARVRDIAARPEVAVLIDRWDEDWSRLAWVRLGGRAEVLESHGGPSAEIAWAVAALRAKYEQYRSHRLEERPIIRIALDGVRSWGNLGQ